MSQEAVKAGLEKDEAVKAALKNTSGTPGEREEVDVVTKHDWWFDTKKKEKVGEPQYAPEDVRRGWRFKADEKLRQEAYRKFDDVMKQMQKWFDSQKPNDPQLREKAETERQKLMRPYVMKTVSDAINKAQGITPPDQEEAAKSGVYKSAEDVRAAYKAGTIKKDEAADILRQQFGHQ
jgi:hypothetical protein